MRIFFSLSVSCSYGPYNSPPYRVGVVPYRASVRLSVRSVGHVLRGFQLYRVRCVVPVRSHKGCTANRTLPGHKKSPRFRRADSLIFWPILIAGKAFD